MMTTITPRWHVKNPLQLHERELIKVGLDLGLSTRQLALYVGRSRTSVVRESKRLGCKELYDPKKAQEDFERKQKNCGIKKVK